MLMVRRPPRSTRTDTPFPYLPSSRSGPVATFLVQQGQLAKGDYLVCGVQYDRVRALFDENGKQVPSAGPSIPVQVLGLAGVPDAGDDFVVVEDERLAKDRKSTRLNSSH